MARFSRDDVLEVLNHIEWKRVLQIQDDLCNLKGVGNSFWELLFHTPAIGWIYLKLDELMMLGWVERRQGTDPTILRERKGRRYAEFRLTETGMRKRSELIERLRESQPIGGIILPSHNTCLSIKKASDSSVASPFYASNATPCLEGRG